MSIAISRFTNDVVKKKKLVEYRQDKLNQDDLQKADFLSRYLVLSEMRYARKRNCSKTGTESSVKSF